MFTRILVPLDGSPQAERAIPVAAKIARASNGTVVLLRVATVPIEFGTALAPSLLVGTIEADRTEFAGYLSYIAGLPALVNTTTETEVLLGAPARTILEAVDDKNIDLVVMTSHGRTGFSRWMLGSVAQQVAHHSVAPVVILREYGATLTSQHRDVEHLLRLLVPLDGSALAEAALEPAAALATALSPKQSALHLTLILAPYEAIEENMPEALAMNGAKEYLRAVAGRLQKDHPGLTVTWTVGVGHDIAETIIRVAESGDDTEGASAFGGCDAIAIATHGRTGFTRWALGSVTERVLHGTKLPLVIVRASKVAVKQAVHAVPSTSARRDDENETGAWEERHESEVPPWPTVDQHLSRSTPVSYDR